MVVALPAGLAVAAYQGRALAAAAPAAVARALAAGLALLAFAFLLRRTGSGDRLHHGLLAIAALGALAAPFLAARLWRDPNDQLDEIARVIALVSVAFIALLFVPRGALRPGDLIPALALAAAALLVLHLRRHVRLPVAARRAADIVLCGIVALVVIQLPDIHLYISNVVLHHGFFLGPANDVLHGRAMLDGAWSQYGVGLIDALALTFKAIPIGFGTLALIIVGLTVVQFLCTYAILRLAGLGQVLTVITIAVAVLGNLFSPLETYFVFPSATALRFGLPYLIILFAVLDARYPVRRRPGRLAMLAVLAIAATWSFETFAYCGGTYGALVLIEAVCAGNHIVRRVLRGAMLGLTVSAVAVILFSLLTLIFGGSLDWGPYLEYLQLYTVSEFGQLPIQFFSAGPFMAAAIFASAVVLLGLARERPRALAPPMWAALAGFTGFAVVSFTYYLGRSHPNNLLVLLVPVVALAGLWMQVLLTAPAAWWRTAVTALITLALAMIAVASWPSVELKARNTALALAVPGGAGSLRLAVERLAENPVLDPRAPVGVELLANHLSPGAPALVLTEPDLTTEVLMRAGRRNLLPISHPPEDVLIESSQGRVRAASEQVPAGTLLLTSPVPGPQSPPAPTGAPPLFNELQLIALSVLHQRFAFRLVERSTVGLELVRLVPRR